MGNSGDNKVCVLLSTYNGERFIEEQLHSLYAQEGVAVSLLVRDDGSSDSTLDILDAEQTAGRLTWYAGENLKPAFSFWKLLHDAPENPYYAFCDQDDVWDADKLQVAVAELEKYGDEPALYFCQTRLVDSSLNEMKSVVISPLLTYGEAISYQFVTGCTMVFNHAMRRILLRYTPHFMRMHDVWAYDVAMAVGAHVFFDAVPHISYRQHGYNVVGQSNNPIAVWKGRVSRLWRNECIRSCLAKELLAGYGDMMSSENLVLTRMAAGYKNSLFVWMKLLFSSKYRCASCAINVTSKLAILLRMF